jgi:hypothetical protein
MKTRLWRRSWWGMLIVIGFLIALLPAGALANPLEDDGGQWWIPTPEPNEVPLSDNGYLYSQIAPKLREFETTSNRVRVEVIGQSAGGRNLFLAIVSAPEALGRLGQYQAIRQTMLKDPEKAQEMIDKFGDFKVPVFVNGSIHGGEVTGVDAIMRLIEKLAYDDSPEVQEILQNEILLFNVVQNPDGRVMGTRGNANGIDINRDFITQSQPETRATVKVYTEWNPMIVLDLHGYVNPMLIEPCTPPHNPNYEYDLYIKWALAQAEAMKAELLAQTGFDAQIPYLQDPLGWDDWPPTYAPMYAMFHGAYGHTMETPYRDERGVDAHYAAVWGALNFVAQNRSDMVRDQIEIFRRGFLSLSQQPIPEELLPEWPQYQDKIPNHFPAAYVIPADTPMQVSAQAAVRLVDFLLFNDLQVEQASQSFTLNDVEYPAGSYVVWMNQPKRGLANTILSDGLDLSTIPGLEFYSPPTVWTHPALWGVRRAIMDEPMEIATHPISKADVPQGSVEGGKAAAYAYPPTSIAAIQATNDLLARGVGLMRAQGPFSNRGSDFGAGMFILPASAPGAKSIANELANRYGLDLVALSALPENAVQMHQLRIAAYISDSGGGVLLKRFGFAFDSVTRNDLNDPAKPALTEYDVFINSGVSLSSCSSSSYATCKTRLTDYFAAGKDYIGIGNTGATLASQIFPGTFTANSYPGTLDSAIRIDYNTLDPVGNGFGEEGYGFANGTRTFTALGADVQVAASVHDPDFLVSGYWPNWQTSGAAGQPIVIRWESDGQDVTLIGLDPIFRAHPEDSFRLVANAIFSGLD